MLAKAATAEILPPTDEIALAEHAAVIRALGKRVVGDIIEIGRRLTEAKTIAGHGGWLPWLKREFGWAEDTARRFISVHEASLKSRNLRDLNVPISGLYLLAAPSTPDEVRQAVIEQAKDGKALTLADVKKAIDEARAQDADKHQREIDALKVEASTAAKRARDEVLADYEGKLIVDPDELEKRVAAAITKATKPIECDLEKTKAKLERAKKRLAEKDEAAPKTAEKIDPAMSFASTGVKMTLEMLVEKLTIDPAAMVEAERVAAALTGQSIADRLGETRAHAEIVVSWLSKLVTLTGGENGSAIVA